MKTSLLMALLAVVAIAMACGDDGNGGDDPSPSETPDASDTPEPEFRTLSREALRAHLTATGLDGMTGDLTNPVGCAELDGETDGEFCIIEPSVYAPALAVIFVADVDNPAERVWQVRLELENGTWEVTETADLAPE